MNYVTKYVTNAEESKVEDTDFKEAGKSMFQKLSKFAFSCLRYREMGTHEAADRILQNNGEFWRSSEKFVWVQTAPLKNRSRTLKIVKDLEGQAGTSKDTFYADLVHDLYPNRPIEIHFFLE